MAAETDAAAGFHELLRLLWEENERVLAERLDRILEAIVPARSERLEMISRPASTPSPNWRKFYDDP